MFRSSLTAVLTLSGTLLHVGSAQALDTVVTFDPAAQELPESVALDSAGNQYLSMGSSIRKRTSDGVVSTWGTLPIQAFALGVKVGLDGCVYTVSTSLDPAVSGAFVWRICTQGAVEVFAELDPAGGPNDLAFDDQGDLYVTDPVLGEIWKVSCDGESSVWLADPLLHGNPAHPILVFRPLGVNGIAFDKQKRNLYVGNLDAGQILRIDVANDGSPGVISVFASSPLLQGADGLAFDRNGQLFVAVNGADRLVSLSPAGALTVRATGGLLDGVSSVAFGTAQHDQRTLYVTSSAFSRAFGLQPGTPHPALLRTDVEHRGLPLP